MNLKKIVLNNSHVFTIRYFLINFCYNLYCNRLHKSLAEVKIIHRKVDKYEKRFTQSTYWGGTQHDAFSPALLIQVQESSAIEQTVVTNPDFGVGQGIEWPKQVVAPYVDITAYSSDEELSNNGALNLAAVAQQTGQKFFKLGFTGERY